MNKLSASQAKIAFDYKNVKHKLLNTNQNIKFNKTCLDLQIIPKYVQIKIKNKSFAAQKTKSVAEIFWIKQEIKFLYRKKNLLNSLLYMKHLELLNALHPTQKDETLFKLDQRINKEVLKKKTIQNKKIDELLKQQVNSNENIQINHGFYKRVVNLTNITFDEPELRVLNKGLKHNFAKNNWKKQIISEIINAETAINSIKDDQNKTVARHVLDRKVNQLDKNNKIRNNKINQKDKALLNSIKNKLSDNNCLVTKADKGQSIVIMTIDDYNKKVNEFITNNNIQEIMKDPTDKFNNVLKSQMNQLNCLFTKEDLKYLKMIDPKAPTLRGLPKVHKDNTPIRPLVNFTSAPSYKLAKKLDKILRENIVLNNNHSIHNNIELTDIIRQTSLPKQFTMASFDVVNLFTNVPVKETLTLVENNLKEQSQLSPQAISETMELLNTVLDQNYFRFKSPLPLTASSLATLARSTARPATVSD